MLLMLSSAPFETPPEAAPQDQLARVEARTALMPGFHGFIAELVRC
jgi:hypothetical protein